MVATTASNGGKVYALNAKAGAKLWNYGTGRSEVFSSPAVGFSPLRFGKSQKGRIGAKERLRKNGPKLTGR